jgi:hypothetical protein
VNASVLTPHIDDVSDDELKARGHRARGIGYTYTVVVRPMLELERDHEAWCTICDCPW